MNRALLLIALECSSGCPSVKSLEASLPRLVLTADAGCLLVPYPLGDHSERGTRLDWLKLPGIADRYRLGAVLRSRM